MTASTPPVPPTPGSAGGTRSASSTPGATGAGTAAGAGAAGSGASGSGVAVEGATQVLPAVVRKVASFAAREIPGVVSLGGAGARAVGAVKQTITGNADNSAGVRVDMEGDTARLALDVEIEYGVGARELTRALRRHIPEAVASIVDVEVVGLDITITDVHLPGGADESTQN